MKALLRVVVTQDHIDRAEEPGMQSQWDGSKCPIHQALLDLGHDRHVGKFHVWGRNTDPDRSNYTDFPYSAVQWIDDFDADRKPEVPFAFTLELNL